MAVLEAFVYDPLLNWRLVEGGEILFYAAIAFKLALLKKLLFEILVWGRP